MSSGEELKRAGTDSREGIGVKQSTGGLDSGSGGADRADEGDGVRPGVAASS